MEQVSQRLKSIENRLTRQGENFEKDLDDFVTSAADSVEIGMRDLMEGRRDWADRSIWEQFKTRDAFHAVMTKFEPLRHRYEREFESLRAELEEFSQTASREGRGSFLGIDESAFQNLFRAHSPLLTSRTGWTARQTRLSRRRPLSS